MLVKNVTIILSLTLGMVACQNKKTKTSFPEVNGSSHTSSSESAAEQTGGFDQIAEQEQHLTREPVSEEAIPADKNYEDTPSAHDPNTERDNEQESPCTSKECQKRNLGRAAYHAAQEQYRKGQWDNALSLYLKSCQYGFFRGCHRYGWHMQQTGNERNALQFFNHSCKQGIERSCNNLGFLAEQRGDLHSAKDFYSYACIQGSKGGCNNLKRIYAILHPKR